MTNKIHDSKKTRLNTKLNNSESVSCYHCGEALPSTSRIFASIDAQLQPMCCLGCKAVAEMIYEYGMEQFYQQRTKKIYDAQEDDYQQLRHKKTLEKTVFEKNTHDYWRHFDSPKIVDTYVTNVDDGHCEIILYIEGIYCSACSWLIDKTLSKTQGVVDVKINIVEKTVFVRWSKPDLKLSDILFKLASFGYSPKPILFVSEVDTKEQRHSALKKLAVSAFGMMQVMSYSVSLYLGEFQGISVELQRFFILLSMLVATIVVFYSGKPFFSNAIRDLRQGSFGMDVPIALAVGTAYAASVYSVFFAHENTVYFDSAIMFVFFLSVSRYIEMIIRHRAVSQRGALNSLMPSVADVIHDGIPRIIPVTDIRPGDVVVVDESSVFPVDGYLAEGFAEARVDESIITGESAAKTKVAGQMILAGSHNLSSAVNIVAAKLGKDTALANIEKLLSVSKASKPQHVVMTELYSRYFVIAILLLAVLAGGVWFVVDSSRVFEIVLSILIISCPCALALAAPAAESIAVQTLLKNGILVVNSTCLSVIQSCRYWVFDKTGTLTSGNMELHEINADEQYKRTFVLELAACLEYSSSHPIATAFKKTPTSLYAEKVSHIAGEGIEGNVNGVDYRIGNYAWVSNWSDAVFSDTRTLDKEGQSSVFIAAKTHFIANIVLKDTIRLRAASVVSMLSHKNVSCHLLSGDSQESVKSVADALNITDYQFECKPEDKTEYIDRLRSLATLPIAMVGDGVNDAPVLSKADIAISMGTGSDLAQSVSDIVFLNNRLDGILALLATAKKFKRVAKQNYAWAIAYNIILLPLAMFGFVTPWLAALGMSFSSLIVVLNATRIAFEFKAVHQNVSQA